MRPTPSSLLVSLASVSSLALVAAGCGGGSGSRGGSTAAPATSGTAATTTGSSTSPGSTPAPAPAPVTALPLPSGPTGGPRPRGIDVSRYQGTIDWAAVAGSGVAFGIARVSDGLQSPDATFRRNWDAMKARGLVRGVYQYFRASQDPVQQADYLLAQVDAAGGFGPGDLPPVCDVETRDGMTAAQVVAQTDRWSARILQRTGMQALIYTSPGFWNPLGAPAHDDQNGLWVAHWGVSAPTVPSGWREWSFWQTSATGTVPGISGAVDTDLWNGSLEGLRAYAGARQAGFHRALAVNSTGRGYWTASVDGGVLAFGDATFRGTGGGRRHPQPVLGIVRSPSGLGYWLFRADGVVLAFGDATHQGDLAGQAPAAPIGAMAATASGRGYWLFGRDGKVRPFGDARALGEPATLSGEVVGAAATPSGLGYWLATAQGVVHAFGDATALGDLSARATSGPVTAIAATPSGRGYWLAQADRVVHAFGDAPALSYGGARTTTAPVVGITASLTGRGYWLVADDGTVFPVGDAVDGGLRAR